MKKAMYLLLVICLVASSFCGCSTTEETRTRDNAETLNMTNYENYLEVEGLSISNWGSECTIFLLDLDSSYKSTTTEYPGYKQIRFGAKIKGASSQFIYKDVSVTFHIEGTYTSYDYCVYSSRYVKYYNISPSESEDDIVNRDFSFDITVNGNVAGNGEGNYVLDIPNLQYSTKGDFKFTGKVVSVSGSVMLASDVGR